MGAVKKQSILVLASSEQCSLLQFHYNQQNDPSKTAYDFDFYQCNIKQIDQIDILSYDYVLFNLALGQPIPKKQLSKLSSRPILVLLEQPTPHQLLELFELDHIKVHVWDQTSFDQLFLKIDQDLKRRSQDIKKAALTGYLKQWVNLQKSCPQRLIFMNPPEDWKHTKEIVLDKNKGHYLIGAISSSADLIVPQSGQDIVAELHFKNKNWKFKILHQNAEQSEFVQVGDELNMGKYLLRFDLNEHTQGIDNFLTSSGLSKELSVNNKVKSQQGNLYDILRSELIKNNSAQIHVQRGFETGYIHILKGLIVFSSVSCVDGQKALKRMLCWDGKVQVKIHESDMKDLKINLRWDLENLIDYWFSLKSKWLEIRSKRPPDELNLLVNLKKLGNIKDMNSSFFKVLTSIIEFRKVKDVVNFCPLDDVEVYEILYSMRKIDFIYPMRK